MKRLELDWVAPPRRPLWPGALVLAAALAVASELALQFHDVRLELSRLETTSDLVGAERRPARAIPRERVEAEAKHVEAVVRQLTLPWALLVETVEQASTGDVALLQLQPDAQQRTLRLTAEARHQAAMLEYLRRLGAAKVLTDVHVVSHQVQREDPRRPVQFVVQAAFREAP